jgi:hypothetical protein
MSPSPRFGENSDYRTVNTILKESSITGAESISVPSKSNKIFL